jgi:hypothetical protein
MSGTAVEIEIADRGRSTRRRPERAGKAAADRDAAHAHDVQGALVGDRHDLVPAVEVEVDELRRQREGRLCGDGKARIDRRRRHGVRVLGKRREGRRHHGGDDQDD